MDVSVWSSGPLDVWTSRCEIKATRIINYFCSKLLECQLDPDWPDWLGKPTESCVLSLACPKFMSLSL